MKLDVAKVFRIEISEETAQRLHALLGIFVSDSNELNDLFWALDDSFSDNVKSFSDFFVAKNGSEELDDLSLRLK